MWIVLGDKGLLDAYRMKSDLLKMNEDNARIQGENEALRREIESLKTDRSTVERIAREELGMVKKGEVVVVFGGKGKSLTSTAVQPPADVNRHDTAP